MRHNDDAFATMLLTLPLSANREELVIPLSPTEFARLENAVANAPLGRIGALLGMDVSGIMQALQMTESEAYRICMLLSRTMPLSYALEYFYTHCIELLTVHDRMYPPRLRQRMAGTEPPCIYSCGDLALLNVPMIAILGISGVKLNEALSDDVRRLIREAVDNGYAILTGGELGVCNLAEHEVIENGGTLVMLLAGDLEKRINTPGYAELIAQKRALCLSFVHPQALYTDTHAAARMRSLYALAHAAFVFTTDGKHGEVEALRNHLCEWIYVYDTDHPAGNRTVIKRGITPIQQVLALPFPQLARNWQMGQSEQLTFFG